MRASIKVSVVPATAGIATHANHPEGAETLRFEDPHWAASERDNSRYRMQGLWRLLEILPPAVGLSW